MSALLGYMARDQYGHTIHMPGATHPRKTLLEKTGGKHAVKMYVDKKDGGAAHIGYIVGGSWFTLYAIHAWEGKA